jgi:hypothetical protein
VSSLLIGAARTLVREQFDVRPGEGVLITVDTHTESALSDAIATAVINAQARPMIAAIPQLPFQGALARSSHTGYARRRGLGRLARLLLSVLGRFDHACRV